MKNELFLHDRLHIREWISATNQSYEGWRDDAVTLSTLYEISRASQGFQIEIQELGIISGVHFENLE